MFSILLASTLTIPKRRGLQYSTAEAHTNYRDVPLHLLNLNWFFMCFLKFNLHSRIIPRILSVSCVSTMAVFIRTKDALFVWTNLGKYLVARLVTRLKHKDGHKKHYASRRTAREIVRPYS